MASSSSATSRSTSASSALSQDEASPRSSGRWLTSPFYLLRSEGLEAKKNAIIDSRSSYDPVESLKPAINFSKAHVRPLARSLPLLCSPF